MKLRQKLVCNKWLNMNKDLNLYNFNKDEKNGKCLFNTRWKWTIKSIQH